MADNPLDTPLADVIERANSRQWDMSPSFLNMNAVDLKQAAGVVATSPFLDLRGHFNYKVLVNIAEVGATVGAFKLTLEEFSAADVVADPITPTALDSEDLITLMDSATNGQKEVLLFGATITPALYSSGGGTGGTKGTNLARFAMMFVGRLKLEITTQADGTSSAATVRFLAGD